MVAKKKRSNKNKTLYRYALVTGAFVFASFLIVAKLFNTTVIQAPAWNARAEKDLNTIDTVPAERGNILADNGNILACNIQVYDTKVDLSHAAIDKIKGGIPWKEIDSLADSLDRYYPLTANFEQLRGQARNDSSWHKKLVEQLQRRPEKRSTRIMIVKKGTIDDFERIKGFPFFKRWKKRMGFRCPVYTESHNKRFKPYGKMARLSIGTVNETRRREIHGFSGMERDLDSLLFGVPGLSRKVTLTRGVANWVDNPPQRGYDIYTTFNIDLQDLLEQELTKVCADSKAEWGTAILMEVGTGEIKALANVQLMKDGSYGEALNRAVRGFEPGSVMKPISLMIAFEDGLVHSVNDLVDCSPFMKTSDHAGGGMKNMKQVIETSSNTGIARVIFRGYAKNPEKYYDRLKSIGFFEPMKSGIGYNEVPYMRRLTEYDKHGVRHTLTERHLDLARHAYGYTSTIPPIYTLSIYNAIANGGKYVRPHVMRRMVNDKIDSVVPLSYIRPQVCSPETAEKVKQCLKETVWGSRGTARRLKDDRVMIAGKTGTVYPMMTDSGGGYDKSRRRLAFCGFFPYDKPKYSCMVLILTNAGYGAAATSGEVLKNVALKMYARGLLDNKSEMEQNPAPSMPLMVNSLKSSISYLCRGFSLGPVKSFVKPDKAVAGCVPDVQGYDAASVVELLERAGYNAVLTGEGHAVSQSIAPGTRAPKGSRVNVTLKV